MKFYKRASICRKTLCLLTRECAFYHYLVFFGPVFDHKIDVCGQSRMSSAADQETAMAACPTIGRPCKIIPWHEVNEHLFEVATCVEMSSQIINIISQGWIEALNRYGRHDNKFAIL